MPLRGDVYIARDHFKTTVVYVSADAILVADPLDVAFGTWLRDELASRFPGRPVTYVVYTGPEFDRAAGGAAFPKATFVSHAEFNSELLKRSKTLPPSLALLDANRDGRLQSSEWSGGEIAAQLSAADANKDRELTPREAYRMVPFGREFFRDRLTLKVGTGSVEIVNPRGSYGTPALYFSDERVLYVGSHPAFDSGNFAFGDTRPRDMQEWMHTVAALPLETVVNGRAEMMDRRGFDTRVRALDDLLTRASAAYAHSSAPKDAATAEIFRSLSVRRVELQVSGLARWMQHNKDYCIAFDPCATGGNVTAGGAALRFVRGHTGAIIEGSGGRQFSSSRESYVTTEEFAQRSSRGSFLFRLGGAHPRSHLDLLMGPTVIFADTRGVRIERLAVAPFGGRHPIAEKTTTFGATAGINLVAPLANAISVFIPVRVTIVPSPPELWPGQLDVQTGIGFSIRMTQRVR